MGGALPPLGSRRHAEGARNRPRRWQDADPTAASGSRRPEAALDARRLPGLSLSQPEQDVRRDARGAAAAVHLRVPGRRTGRALRPTLLGRLSMARRHTVRFEPVGIELDAYEDETILEAAFRQGITLPHGCKEGQCSACKSFLLDGEVDLDKYSTFALPDFEEAEGWTLLCRAPPYSDLEVGLINYDEEMIRSGLPIKTVTTT